MLNSTSLAIIQKYILLATSMPNSAALQDKIVALQEQTDDLGQVAKLADTFMTELNENSDYSSSQAANAAREWLASIRATDESLATSTEAIQGLIDSFNDGSVQSKAIAENGDGGDSAATTPLAAPLSSPPADDDHHILII